jgi:DNA-cytosine methyltransferase
MRFVSLFAGVGGFDLGFERAGHTCVGQVEIDQKCQQVLAKHWPDVPKHDDVVTAKDWADDCGITGNVDLVCGGFPCQDVSVAGKRAGLAGQRTGLFWDALSFATHVKARWIMLENVPGLLSSNEGRDFGVVVTALADAGYHHVEWKVLDSQFFGVPQRRRRVFIVASVAGPGRSAVFVESEGRCWDSSQVRAEGKGVTGTATGSFASVDFRHGTVNPDVTSTLQSKNQGGYSLNYTPGVIGFSHNQGLDIQASPDAFPTLRVGGGGLSVMVRESEKGADQHR